MKLLPGVKALDNFLREKAKPTGEHPDAVPIKPLFKDWDEDSWLLRPFSWSETWKRLSQLNCGE